MLSLRPGNVHAAPGADDDLAYLVTRLRRAWPAVVLHFRGDWAFGVPGMYEVCEGLSVSYTFGREGHPCTWRMLLIKGAAEVVVRTRRIVIRLSSSWPHLRWYRRVCERVRDPRSNPAPDPSD
jgi:hypothetical protein